MKNAALTKVANPRAIYIKRDENAQDEVVIYYLNEQGSRRRLPMTREQAGAVMILLGDAIVQQEYPEESECAQLVALEKIHGL